MLKKPIKKSREKDNEREPRQPKKASRFSRLRGMKDILFDEARYWDLVEKKANDMAAVYGYKRIITPVLERAELYERSTGKETDIVSKEMYSFTDKSGDRVAMRPEATPGLVRSYIEHGMFNLPQPVKMYWLGPLFRHEKPQAGRWRQHHQFDIEIFGEASPVADAQVILIAYNFCSELQIDVQIQINSIGCQECRAEYAKKLIEFYKERGKRAKLCPDCKKRFTRNPLRLLDCKEEGCASVRDEAPQMVDYLCDACRDHFIKVLEYLDELDIPYNLNPFLVRGLDYYNRTVFEIWPGAREEEAGQEKGEESALKRQSSLGGGGRYDGLIEYMGGRPTPALGFGIGIERIIMKIKEKNIPLKEDCSNLVFIAQLGEQARRKTFALFEELRRSGFAVRQAFTKDGLKPQLEEADRSGAKYSLILGQKELIDGTILIRDMESGTQEVIDYKKIAVELNKRLSEQKS
jgi:histidyl-tRNA synthetase